MEYILIVGASHAGKSSTVNEVCKRLNPEKVLQLRGDDSNKRFEEVDDNLPIKNGTYLILVKGKSILIVAGSPTEQCITITVIIEICIRLKIKIDFIFVVMRLFEKKEGYDTPNELKKIGNCIYQETIYRIQSDKYKETKEWQGRIEKILKTIQSSLNN